MKIGFLGFGEVGRALGQIEKEAGNEVLVRDLERDELAKVDILHLCLPYNEGFLSSAISAIRTAEPSLIINNATVPVGTTRKIGAECKIEIVHSPIRGMHPNMVPGIKTFPKLIGPTSPKSGELANKHFQELGLTTVLCQDAETTEFAKLYDTLYYAWNIVFCKEIDKLCREKGINFDQAYTLWNQTYNEGYNKLGKPNVARPVLTPQPGQIGGHCVIPNAKLAFEQFKDPLSKFVLDSNSTYSA
ncbi:MAG: hypothetical protein Q8N84_02950 [bacterium]|nr:hypothetical protein [bacterium]